MQALLHAGAEGWGRAAWGVMGVHHAQYPITIPRPDLLTQIRSTRICAKDIAGESPSRLIAMAWAFPGSKGQVSPYLPVCKTPPLDAVQTTPVPMHLHRGISLGSSCHSWRNVLGLAVFDGLKRELLTFMEVNSNNVYP